MADTILITSDEITVVSTSEQGPPGAGVPLGGTTGQYLKKNSDTDLDTVWSTSTTNMVWGDVTGTLSEQGDLQAELDAKLDAFSGVEGNLPISDPYGGLEDSGIALSDLATTDYVDLVGDALTLHEADTTAVHGIADTSLLETTTGSASKVSVHNADTTAVHGIADTSLLETTTGSQSKVDSGIATHNNDTTSVHGITDTSALETTTGSALKVTNHNALTQNVHGIADTDLLATTSEVNSAISDAIDLHKVAVVSVHGIANTALLETTTGAQTKVNDGIAAHTADTTNVHGITDTSLLETAVGSALKVTNHNADTTAVHGIADTSALATSTDVTAEIGVHNAETTSVHGITDTANLVYTSGATFTGEIYASNLLNTNTGDQDLSGLVPKTTTVNSKALSSNITLTKSDISLGNVVNLDTSTTANITDSTDKRFVTDDMLTDLTNYDTTIGTLVPKTTTVNSKALTGNITLNKSDIGLGSVVNVDTTTTANITDSANKRFLTDAELAVVQDTSNTNTGDEDTASIKTKLGAATASDDGYLTAADWTTFNNKLDTYSTRIPIPIDPVNDNVGGFTISITAGDDLTFGDLCRIDSNSKAQLGDADSIATSSCFMICAGDVLTAAAGTFLIPPGIATKTTWSWTPGSLLYLDTDYSTAGQMTHTPPTATNSVTQIIGVAITTTTILFNPSLVQIEHV